LSARSETYIHSNHEGTMRGTAKLLIGLALLAGCSDDPVSSEDQDLAALRTLTQPFQSFEAGKAAGYDAPFMGCFANDSGAMGIHYQNTTIDLAATPAVDKPPFLMYEPQQDGTMRLVGVEYVKAPPTDPAPRLYNQSFTYNTGLKVWALHVWAWKRNPSGLYANWNPTVTCKFAPQTAAMAHP
jgi:hypothetical protein